METRRYKCMSAKCLHNDEKHKNNCGLLKNTNECTFPFIKGDEDAVADVQPAMTGVDCLDGVEVVAIEKYRGGFTGLSNDYNKARVTISLKFPEHLNLYYKLKGMAD